MFIIYKNYVIEPEFRMFNLFKTGNKKRIVMGYGLRFETMIDTIVKDSLEDINEQVTFQQYIDAYKKLKEEVLLNVKA